MTSRDLLLVLGVCAVCSIFAAGHATRSFLIEHNVENRGYLKARTIELVDNDGNGRLYMFAGRDGRPTITFADSTGHTVASFYVDTAGDFALNDYSGSRGPQIDPALRRFEQLQAAYSSPEVASQDSLPANPFLRNLVLSEREAADSLASRE